MSTRKESSSVQSCALLKLVVTQPQVFNGSETAALEAVAHAYRSRHRRERAAL